MTHPAIKFATKFKTSPANYWVAKDLYSETVKKNKIMKIKDIQDFLNKKGVVIKYHTLYYWLRK